MLKNKIILLFVFAFFTTSIFPQGRSNKSSRDNFSRIELSFSIGYSRPLLEAYGEKVTINAAEDQLFIDGKRLIDSDNLGLRYRTCTTFWPS